jgi:hypothetical protein
MSAAPILIFILGCFLWLFRYRFRGTFLRVYGLFFLILIIYATNKAYYGISPEMSEGTFSPLSLIRWGSVVLLAWYAWRAKLPDGFRSDVGLTVIVILLLGDMLFSRALVIRFYVRLDLRYWPLP